MSMTKKDILNPVTVQFTTDVVILKQLYSQHFGKDEAERIALCSLAKTILGLPDMVLGSVKLERPKNASGTIITVRSMFSAFTPQQIDAIQAHIDYRLHPMHLAALPPINEEGLKARLEQDEFIPDQNNKSQILFAGPFNEHTLPGVRGHGGHLKVKGFIDEGPNGYFSVELIAHGSCMECGDAGTLTLSQLQRIESDMFEQMSEMVEGRKFGNIHVYSESNPNQLSYVVKADGVYDATGQRTHAFGLRQG